MFNKNVRLFLITLIFILSIAAVSAADTNSTDDVAIGDSEEEPPSGDVQEVPTNDNGASTNDNGESTSVNGASADGKYSLVSNDVNMFYMNGSCYEVTLLKDSQPVKNESLSVNINGKNYEGVTDESGKLSIPIDLNSGSYVVSTSFRDVAAKNNIKVLPVVYGSDVVKTYGSATKYTAKFLDKQGNPLKERWVHFILKGKQYDVRTNAKGIAQLDLNLNVGTYTVYAIHSNGYKISNKITVKTSIIPTKAKKFYYGSKKVSAIFYGKDGKRLVGKYVRFEFNGKSYVAKTNKKGVAVVGIYSNPGTSKLSIKNLETGETVKKYITILPTLKAKKVYTFSDKKTKFKVTLYKNEKLVKNAKVYIFIKGVKKVAKTNAKGVAYVKFLLPKGKYKFVSQDPYTGYKIKTKVFVRMPTIKAKDMVASPKVSSKYKVTVLQQNGKVAKGAKVQFTFNGAKLTVKTDSKGEASFSFYLDKGTYTVQCKDLSNGYEITKKITVKEKGKYSKYGVSSDGSTILAIGRPSTASEESKYGYTFYMTEFERKCPHCGSHELYWGIFWAGSETANWGRFPATGYMEGGSAEGHIFCAHCDSDWSVFGHEHVTSGGKSLKVVSATVKSSKADAYKLKNGNYVKS